MQEWDELRSFLGSEPESFNESAFHAAVAGKRVLITGAAGFIGSALGRFLARYPLEHLSLLDIAESGLHDLLLDLDRNCAVAHDEIVGDVCDAMLLRDVFHRYSPQIVLHAAACKHVPLMEKNPFAAAKTNVLGTRQVVQAAASSATDELILVSTDKAVHPTSIMGATKRIAELIALADRGVTRVKAVRLGNVWGSTGSVVPILQGQIAQGDPITITDVACTRHFLSIEAAVQCLISALLVERASPLLVSAPTRSYRIVDLANLLVDRAGVSRSRIEFKFVGLRPGEKISERMFADEEKVDNSSIHDLREVLYSPAPPEHLLATAIEEIGAAVGDRDRSRLLQAVLSVVPEYVPSVYLHDPACHSVVTSSTV